MSWLFSNPLWTEVGVLTIQECFQAWPKSAIGNRKIGHPRRRRTCEIDAEPVIGNFARPFKEHSMAESLDSMWAECSRPHSVRPRVQPSSTGFFWADTQATMNAARLFVGNLSYNTLENDLMEHFAGAGVVHSADIVFDKFTGKSRGFAFVEMSSPEEANRAVEMYHNKEFQGRNLTVNVARPREDRPPRQGGGGGGGGGYRGDRGDRRSQGERH